MKSFENEKLQMVDIKEGLHLGFSVCLFAFDGLCTLHGVPDNTFYISLSVDRGEIFYLVSLYWSVTQSVNPNLTCLDDRISRCVLVGEANTDFLNTRGRLCDLEQIEQGGGYSGLK